MPFAALAELARGIIDPSYISDYFFMYCNEGRGDKVVLTLSDSLYKKRVTTSGPPTTITKLGFRSLCRRLGLAGSAQDTDLIFMRNLGVARDTAVSRDTSKPPKFELDLDQACDALQMAAEQKYPHLSPVDAWRAMLANELLPAAEVDFPGFTAESVEDATGIGDDAKSSVSNALNPRRSQRVVLTTQGSAVAGAHAGLGVHVSNADATRPLSARHFGGVDSGGAGGAELQHRPARRSIVSGLSTSFSVDPYSSEAHGAPTPRSEGAGDAPAQQQQQSASVSVSPPRHRLQAHIEPPTVSIFTEPLSGGGSSPQNFAKEHSRSVAELKGALMEMVARVGRQQARIAELEAVNAALSAQLQQQPGSGSAGGGGGPGAGGLPSPPSHARF